MCASINIEKIINNDDEININMTTYTVAVTKTGQMTLPKAVREMLGITTRAVVKVNEDKKTVNVYRVPSWTEQLDEVRASFSLEMKETIKKNAGKNVAELRKEWDNSAEGKAYYKEKYGL